MKVLAIGDNVMDIYLDSKRIFPGGNAVNFSVMATRMPGITSGYLGNFGNDNLAELMKNTLKKFNVNIDHCKNLKGESGYSLVKVVNGDRKFLASNRGGVLNQGIKISDDKDYINAMDLIHLSVNGKGKEIINYINKPKIVYDYSDFSNEDEITLTINNVDLACFSVGNISKDKVVERARQLQSMGNYHTILLFTMGKQGAMVFTGNRCYYQSAQLTNHIKDTMGAGDSFITYFSTGLLRENWDISSIPNILKSASLFSAKQLQIDGSLGVSFKIPDLRLKELCKER